MILAQNVNLIKLENVKVKAQMNKDKMWKEGKKWGEKVNGINIFTFL